MSITRVLAAEKDALMQTELCQGATRFVGIRGSENPTYLFVGEAPGKREDEEGEPFVGRAGRLLDTWIDGLGLDESEYAITNVVKCRPPNNRAPTKEEADEFGQWLAKEVDALQPAIIFTLGTTATEYILPETSDTAFLKEACYTKHDSRYGTVIPLPHPAYGLRQGGMDLPYQELQALAGDTGE